MRGPPAHWPDPNGVTEHHREPTHQPSRVMAMALETKPTGPGRPPRGGRGLQRNSLYGQTNKLSIGQPPNSPGCRLWSLPVRPGD